MPWLRERSLTLVMLGLFSIFAVGQMIVGWHDYNSTQVEHGERVVTLGAYVRTGHFWEAIFENWESEFLQMAAFVVLTTRLVQKGSPESRRPGAVEPQDADPRRFTDAPDAPWPVRRGGLILTLYERSLGSTLFGLFLISWVGHAAGGYAAYRQDELAHGQAVGSFGEYVLGARFWFESLQNWQSEFLSIAAMVWLSVYLRQRGSPESKPVHVPHSEND